MRRKLNKNKPNENDSSTVNQDSVGKKLVKFIKQHFTLKGFKQLTGCIPCEGKPEGNKEGNLCTKRFINILKIRIHFYAPEQMQEILKNEAHIRLMNSVWYVTKSIKYVAIITAFISLIILIFGFPPI
jgi:hypothetical protein